MISQIGIQTNKATWHNISLEKIDAKTLARFARLSSTVSDRIMIRIKYSEKPYTEIALEGSKKEMIDLRQTIIDSKSDKISVSADTNFDPSPYQSFLKKLFLIKTNSLLEISVEDQSLCVSGMYEFIKYFAENLPYDIVEYSSDIPYHVHFDRSGREEHVKEGSLDIVLTLTNID